MVVTLQDMTPLEEMERLRAEFLGMVSHELRTPLTSIKGSAATLTEAASDLDPAEMLQFSRIIGEQADYMRDLIGDLLDVARIETGELSVAPAPAEVATLVDEARSRFQSGGGRNNLRIELSPELPLVMADGRRIIQVLSNLLSNAARHSHEASAIGVSAVREGYHVVISVTDEGRGIAAERLPHLFRKFSRLEGEDRGRDIAGSGLGLAICKGIVEAHGGRIWVESDGPGLGARFTFTIPVAQDAAIGAANLPVRSRRSERERERILAVDDDPHAPARPGRPNEGGLHACRNRSPGGGAQLGGGERPPPGAAGPDAAGNRHDDHGVEDGRVILLQSYQLVGQPRDGVGLAAASRVLNQILRACSPTGCIGQQPPHHVQLVIARPYLIAPLAARLVVFHLDDLGVVLNDVGQPVSGEHLLPQVIGLEAVGVRRIACTVVSPLVEGQEP